MFDSEFKLVKEQSNNVITTEKNSISFIKYFILQNKKSIIYKKRNKMEILRFLVSFCKNMKNG